MNTVTPAQETAMTIYRMTRGATTSEPADTDLVRLAEAFPEMRPVLEEVQALRDETADLHDMLARQE